ncbi:MAG: hypothetical protein WC265_01800, partial [Dysgonamonadaceae bacterium]
LTFLLEENVSHEKARRKILGHRLTERDVKTGQPGILNALADVILMRDIAVRHAVRYVSSLRQLTTWAGVLRIWFSSICVGQINNFSITRIRENVTS